MDGKKRKNRPQNAKKKKAINLANKETETVYINRLKYLKQNITKRKIEGTKMKPIDMQNRVSEMRRMVHLKTWQQKLTKWKRGEKRTAKK